MQMLVHLLVRNLGGLLGLLLNGLSLGAGVLETRIPVRGLAFYGRIVMLNVLDLGLGVLVVVLLWQDFTILRWLDGGVVEVLVPLLVDHGLLFLLVLRCDGLVLDGWSYVFLNGGDTLVLHDGSLYSLVGSPLDYRCCVVGADRRIVVADCRVLLVGCGCLAGCAAGCPSAFGLSRKTTIRTKSCLG